MRQVGIRQARADLPKLVKQAQDETQVLTHHGKPAALLVGIRGYDFEDLVRMLDPDFWKMLAERRRSDRPTLSLAELDQRLAGRRPDRPTRRRGRRGATRASAKPRAR